MDCAEFFQGKLADRITMAADESSPEKWTPVIFAHVPKTGGTSLQRDLHAAFPDSIHIPQEGKEWHWQDAQQRLQNDNPSVIRGHLGLQHLNELENQQINCRMVTYLRHPIERLVSQYLWQKANLRKKYQDARPFGSFQAFCDRCPTNYICELLVGPVDSASEAIEKMVQRFWFVGVTEYFHVCQAVLFAALNKNYRIRPRRNQTVSSTRDREEIDPACLQVVQEKMEFDLAVYDYFHARWSNKVNEAVELLMRAGVNSRPKLDVAA